MLFNQMDSTHLVIFISNDCVAHVQASFERSNGSEGQSLFCGIVLTHYNYFCENSCGPAVPTGLL